MFLAPLLLLLQVPAPSSSGAVHLAGNVVDAISKAPIAGAMIEIVPSNNGEPPRRVAAGPAGEFNLPVTGHTVRFVAAPPPLQATHLPKILTLELAAGATRAITVALDPAHAIEGRVLDELDEPMANVRMVAEPLDAADLPSFRGEHFSDDRGVFRVFGLANGRYRVCAVPQRPGPSGYSRTCEPVSEGSIVTIRMRRLPSEQVPATAPPANWIGIRGRVSDEQSRQSLPRALVSLAPPSGGDAHEVVADERGRFEVHVPPGPYTLRATAGEFKSTHVARGQELLLLPGDTFGDFEVALPRASTVSGTVTNTRGIPLAGVLVELVPEGATTPLAFEHSPTTDDRGRFRVHGVPRGRYSVCGNPQSARQQGAPPAWMYGRACYPAAISVVDGNAVVSAIRLDRLGAYTVTGRIIGPASELSPGTVATVRGNNDGQLRMTTVTVAADGSFEVSRLIPGVYNLSAFTGLSRQRTEQNLMWAGVRIEIVDADVRDVILQLSEGVSVRGRVALDEPGTDRPLRGIEVRAFPIAFELQGPQPSTVETDDDGAFVLHRIFGSVVLRVRPPHGYVVKSIRHAGRDITDVPSELGNDAGFSVDILLTRGTAELSGRVRDDLDRAVEDAGVLYFPADPARWKAYEGGLRQQSLSGRYRITGLGGGEYLVIAVRGPRPGWTEKDYEMLAPLAERVTLQDGEQRVLDLRVVTLPR